ncbi:MAG: DUF1667 domain-containing protein [Clostridium sp.]|uniref:DUF1667 domain-containing protein n=1 Tax=Clostridium sp. TaxID=1506 RepID=UPI003EE68933
MLKELICIVCPKGCHLTVDTENETVTGNTCPRGKVYGLNEVKNPTRVVTSTIKIQNCDNIVLPVKTSVPIPKDMIFAIMKEINNISISLPIKTGDIILENVLNTGSNIVATKSLSLSL